MQLLGIDLGSSSIKVSVIDAETGKCLSSATYPRKEMPIKAEQPGWAEQDPEMWWKNVTLAVKEVLKHPSIIQETIEAIGISYQMHGLVLVDKHSEVLRPSIIWCDSRAVDYGKKAFREIGEDKCLARLLNSPGNFTASKLKWVKENEPQTYRRIHKIMLPGDFIAMKLTGEINTTLSGLSEGIFWDFKHNQPADFLLDYYGLENSLLPDQVPTFSSQGQILESVARDLGLSSGVKVTYRAGDQPNNAFSLNILNPGEVAATAGTSGVVYGVSEEVKYDPESRINSFAHVNHTTEKTRIGVLLCINGTGILNSWLRNQVGGQVIDYKEMNKRAAAIPVGSEGLCIMPFGNGAERMLGNKDLGCRILNLNFNLHRQDHLFRAAQEGIAFAFRYGMDIMRESGISPDVIRAGMANMFLSPVFREELSCLTGSTIELYNTDGSQGAARGAGIGAGIYSSFEEAFRNLDMLEVTIPDESKISLYQEAYFRWKQELDLYLISN
ncbi:MAG: carbohydrate kinase [Bacteroidales bacterium]|nr:carbohydrate kinase [Bacteroidales bacterium]